MRPSMKKRGPRSLRARLAMAVVYSLLFIFGLFNIGIGLLGEHEVIQAFSGDGVFVPGYVGPYGFGLVERVQSISLGFCSFVILGWLVYYNRE